MFTYSNPGADPVGIGDLVRVRLQGRPQSGLVVGLPAQPPEGLDPARLLPIDGVLQAAAVDAPWRRLIEAVAAGCHTSAFNTLRSALPPGWLGSVASTGRGMARHRWLLQLRDGQPGEQQRLGPRQRALLELLQQRGGRLPQAELEPLGFSTAVVRGLERRGLVERTVDATCAPAAPLPLIGSAGRVLTAAQAAALQAINSAAAGTTQLLWGVTGAGKTEVYLQAAAYTLRQGQGVLLLTPEIGLVPQLLDRCRERFGATVLEWHSGLGDAERIRCWRRCLAAAAALALALALQSLRRAIVPPLPQLPA